MKKPQCKYMNFLNACKVFEEKSGDK